MTAPAVSTRALTVAYDGFVALDDITLDLAQGSFVAVVGPNGGGKSTLLRSILGLQRPTSGSVSVLGRAPVAVAPQDIGYVPQIKTLDRSFPARAYELVLTGLMNRWPARKDGALRGRAFTALDGVGAAHLADRSLSSLSGGELQRVYLARSLSREPKLVILDEPATGVDAIGETDLYHTLDRYQDEHGATIILVTHDWEVAYHHATDVLVLNRSVVGFGSPETALAESVLRKAFGHVGHEHTMILGDDAHG